MLCPQCRKPVHTKVIDSRGTSVGGQPNSIRRRRVCLICQTRFTTYEVTLEQLTAIDEKTVKVEMLQAAIRSILGL